MKKITFYAIATTAFAALTGNVMAQTGVGINNSGASAADCALLDVSSTTLGELIPRVALTVGTTTYGLSGTSTNANSMLVYNTATVVNATPSLSLYPGFYYWSTSATKWIPLVSGTSGWLLNGNYGTTATGVPATYGTSTLGVTGNWLGTADAQSLVMGTDNIERMRILSGGNVGIGTAAPTSLFHVNDGAAAFTTTTLAAITSSTVTTGTLLSLNASTAAASASTSNCLALTNSSPTGNLIIGNSSAATSNIMQFNLNSLTSGRGLYLTTSSLTTGNLMEVDATNASGTASTSNAMYIENSSPTGNSIYAVGFGNYSYSSIFAKTTPGNSGIGYDISQSSHAIAGEIGTTADAYTFGVLGETLSTGLECGGVVGVLQSKGYWASLGYQASGGAGSAYSLYYYGGAGDFGSGAGYMADDAVPITGIGSGGIGGIIGSWTRGQVMGSISCGELFASYSLGNAYTSGYSAEVVTVKDKRVAAYSVTSTDIKVYNDGTGKLTSGKTHVSFDRDFAELIGENKPVVTVTPMGQCNGVYITNITATGFDVVEQNNGSSDVEFSYIVVGKRLDASDKPELPEALAQKDFDKNMKGVMHDETDKEHAATPVWWDGKQLRFDHPPVAERK